MSHQIEWKKWGNKIPQTRKWTTRGWWRFGGGMGWRNAWEATRGGEEGGGMVWVEEDERKSIRRGEGQVWGCRKKRKGEVAHWLVSVAALVRAETHVKLVGRAVTLLSECRGIAQAQQNHRVEQCHNLCQKCKIKGWKKW